MTNQLRFEQQFRRKQMSVEISSEERDLKEEKARVPDGRRAAKPWQDRFADQRLHLKQQVRVREHDQSEDDIQQDNVST
ncbi:MAG: hypothetical protein ABGZ35_27160 [Planctomycetaceae bacterium]